MKVLICGGRDYTDTYQFDEAMKMLTFTPTVIIQGGARGADALAAQWGKMKGISVVQIDALWDFYGKKAGSRRNQSMIEIMHPDYCIAFPGGFGTNDMVKRCQNAGIVTWLPYTTTIDKSVNA
ncbi:DUF2493 domain-containing protein [Yersinia ruckeri]|nr:DUF2493 domain-containing protein [Yersinia ruckeri]MCW6550360.1 DUF2493 domain-containing protein [Yersinia ruckeri]